jgi:hypothetical protein
LMQEFVNDPSRLYLINRLVSVGFGIAAIALLYFVTQRIHSRRTAIIAALFLSLAHLHVRDSHFGMVEVTQTFFILLAILFILRSYDEQEPRHAMGAGICSGLALSTGYTALPLILSMAIALSSTAQTLKPKVIWSSKLQSCLEFMGGLLLAFIGGTPFALLDAQSFIAGVLEFFHPTNPEEGGLLRHGLVMLPLGVGWCLLIAALFGIGLLLRRDPRKSAILLSFPIAYILLVRNGSLHAWVIIVPFICMAAAIFVSELAEYLSQRTKFAVLLLTTLIVLQPTLAIAQSDRLLATPDNRLLAADWMRKNAAPGSSIYQTGRVYGQMVLERSPRLVIDQLKQVNGQTLTESQLRIYQSDTIEAYPQWTYDPSVGIFYFAQKLQKQLPDYIIIQENPVDEVNLVDAGIADMVQNFYRLKRSFRAMDIHNPQNRFDPQDDFYLPLGGFKNVIRPGTNLYIYQLNSETDP